MQRRKTSLLLIYRGETHPEGGGTVQVCDSLQVRPVLSYRRDVEQEPSEVAVEAGSTSMVLLKI